MEVDETYIEVFDVGSTVPAFLKQFVVEPAAASPDPEYDVTRAGYANDVAITRDGAWAVVNSDNWIHVVNLANPKGHNGLIGFNIGKFAYTQGEDPVQWDWPCSPNQAVDSIALTNDRAVVTTARERRAPSNQVGAPTTWVYIIDFNGSNGPEIVLEQDLAPPATWTPLGCVPLDLAMSPITNQLVVRSSDPYFLAPSGSPQEIDVVFVSLTPGVGITAQFPGNGYQLGMDSLAAPATGYVNTNKRILSITQDPITRPPGLRLQPHRALIVTTCAARCSELRTARAPTRSKRRTPWSAESECPVRVARPRLRCSRCP